MDHTSISQKIAQDQQEKIARDAAAAKSNNTQNGWYDKKAKNLLTPDDVNFGPGSKDVDFKDKIYMIAQIKKDQEDGPVRGDGPKMTEAIGGIWKMDGYAPITSEDQLKEMRLRGELSQPGFDKARHEFQNSARDRK